MTMLPSIEKKFNRLQNALEDTFIYMDGLSIVQRLSAPPKSWNAVQILHHIRISEAGTIGYLSKKLLAPASEVKHAGIAGWIRSVLLRRALRNYKKKFRAPKMLADMPEKPDYETEKGAILENRKRFATLLNMVTKEQVGRAYFNHPRAGRINILHTLDFLEDHFNRHAAQIRERSQNQ